MEAAAKAATAKEIAKKKQVDSCVVAMRTATVLCTWPNL